MKRAVWLASLALLAGAPTAAHAHLVNSGLGPFYNGALHLLLSPGDLLALLAVGLLAGQSGKAGARWAAVLLPLAWVAAVLGTLALGTVPDLGWLEVALLILLGILVAVGVSLPVSVMASLAVLTGLVHGLENGGAFTAGGIVAVAGLAAAILILGLLTAALAVSLRAAWTRIALRVGGSWIAAIGMLMLGWLLQGAR